MRDFILRHKKKSPYVHRKRWREQSRKKPNDNTIQSRTRKSHGHKMKFLLTVLGEAREENIWLSLMT